MFPAVHIMRSLISVGGSCFSADGSMLPRLRFCVSLLTISCFLGDGFMFGFAARYDGFVLSHRPHDTVSLVASTGGRSWRASTIFSSQLAFVSSPPITGVRS